ncbi:hypothetical protein AB2D83_07860 [Escherichia coli]|nr:hypothetical protein [Escherichia coli]MDC8787542.1 hypothetical protein [Escherichia coli]MDE3863277.1 hypothetical protein [Escherichia coli]GCM12862.1 hypothetical protein ExPECSC049_04317 [Escherichia coli]
MRSPDRGSTTGAASWTDHEHSEWAARRASEASQSPLTVIFKEKRVRKYELFSHFICLFDSEPAEEQQFVKYEFLSSLYGSEPSTSTSFAEYSFLSCLYGSERVRKGFTAPRRFLSCLYGSELKYYTFSSLLIKQNHLIFLLAPFFILTFQHH